MFKIGDLESAALKYFESDDEEFEDQYFIDCSNIIKQFVSAYYRSEYIFSTFTYLRETGNGIFPKTFYNYAESETRIKPYIDLLVERLIPENVSVSFTDILTKNKNLGLLLHNGKVIINYDDIEVSCNLNDFQIEGSEILDKILHSTDLSFKNLFSKISFDHKTIKKFIDQYASSNDENYSKFFSILTLYYRISAIREGELFFYFLRPTILHEEFNGIYSLCVSRALTDLELKKIQLLIYRVYSKIAIKKLQVSKRMIANSNVRNTIRNILSRNFSHNIGSHVMHNADISNIIGKIITPKFTINATEEINAYRYSAALKAILDRYIVQRNEYLADVSESTMPAGNYAKFYAEVIMPFVENYLISDNIAAAEGIGFSTFNSDNSLQIRVFVDNRELITLYDTGKEESKLLKPGIKAGYPNWGIAMPEGEPLRLPYYLPLKVKGHSFQDIEDPLALIQAKHLESFFHSKKIIARGQSGTYISFDGDAGDVEVALPGVLGKHAFYSLLENFIRNSAKHNKEKLKNERLIIEIRLDKLSSEDMESGRFETEHDAWKVRISDSKLSRLNKDQLNKLEEYVNAPLIAGQTGEPRTTGLGIADMVVSASVLAGSFDFDFSDNKLQNKYLQIEPEQEEDGKYSIGYSFYLLKAKRVICLTKTRRDEGYSQTDWQAHGITFVSTIEDMYRHMSRQAYRMAVLDADLLDAEFREDELKYEELLSRLPFRIIVKETRPQKNTPKHWDKLAKQRRVVIYNHHIEVKSPIEFRRFCWEQWLKLFYPELKNRLPLQVHLYLEHEHPRWEGKQEESFNGLLDIHVYHSKKNKTYQHRDDAVNLIYDHHGQLLQSLNGKANFLDSDSYTIFDKNSADFPRLMYPDDNTLEVLPYMMAEAGLLRVLVMDERVAERANLDADTEGKHLSSGDSTFAPKESGQNNSVFELAWAGGVHIATHYQINDEEERPLNDKPLFRNDARKLTLHIKVAPGEISKIWFSSNLTHKNHEHPFEVGAGHYDILLIHRTILKHIQESVQKIQKEVLGIECPDFEFLRDIKDVIPFTVVDSGGGYPDEIRQTYKGSFKFLPFSFMSEHLMSNRIAKVGLTQILMGLTDAKHT